MYRSGRHSVRLFTYVGEALTAMLTVIAGLAPTPANASAPTRNPASYTSIAQAPNGGYWIQVDDADGPRTVAIDGAPQYPSVPKRGTIIGIPGTSAYWVVTTDGYIYARGGATPLCGGNPGRLTNCSGYRASEVITGAAPTPNGGGLWAVDYDRHVWTAGNAVSYGDVTGDNRTPSGITATPSGLGYYVVMNDGGVFSFGDAHFYGSTGGEKPGGHDVTGLSISIGPSGRQNGYWLVADDGGIFCFGDAPFLGSTGGNNGGSFVTSIVTRLDRHSYAWVHANGQVGLSRTIPSVVIKGEASIDVGVWGVTSNDPSDGIYRLPSDGSTSQQWELWPTDHDSEIVQIVNVSSGLCADVEDFVGPFMIQYPCKTSNEGWNNQRFQIISSESCYSQPPCVDFAPVSSSSDRVSTGEDSQLWISSLAGGFWKVTPVEAMGQRAARR